MSIMQRIGTDSRRWTATMGRWVVIGLMGASVLTFSTALNAAKGGNSGKPGDSDPPDPPPPVEAGLVYLYGWNYGESWDWLVEVDTSDGSTRIVREVWLAPTSGFYQPSRHDHNGRWFAVNMLAPEDGEYPADPSEPSIRNTPMTRRAIYAMPENGDPVKILFDPWLEPMGFYASTTPRWVAGDSEIWFLARKLYTDGAPVPGSLGFYKVGVEFSGGTIQVVTAPTMVEHSPVFEADYSRHPADVFVQFDVTEDGSTVIYTAFDENGSQGIYEFDVVDGTHTYKAESSIISPDYNVSKNAVVGRNTQAGLLRYNLVDGYSSVLVETDKKKSAFEGAFSPSGDQVAYVLGKSVRGDYHMSLSFVTSDGATDLGDLFTMDKMWILDWF